MFNFRMPSEKVFPLTSLHFFHVEPTSILNSKCSFFLINGCVFPSTVPFLQFSRPFLHIEMGAFYLNKCDSTVE